MNVWQLRAVNVAKLGFASYQDYLGSDLWRRIRESVLIRANYRCQACRSRRANQVHHRDYRLATLAGKTLAGLTAICRKCHELGSVENAIVLTPFVTNARLGEIRRKKRTRRQRKRGLSLATITRAAAERERLRIAKGASTARLRPDGTYDVSDG